MLLPVFLNPHVKKKKKEKIKYKKVSKTRSKTLRFSIYIYIKQRDKTKRHAILMALFTIFFSWACVQSGEEGFLPFLCSVFIFPFHLPKNTDTTHTPLWLTIEMKKQMEQALQVAAQWPLATLPLRHN